MAPMTFEDLKSHYGSIEKARTALGLKSRQTLYNWRDGGIPDGEQCRIELLTEGALKADESSVNKKVA